jgi:hypothetical protein
VAYELRAEVAKWKHDAELAIDLEYNQGQRVDELRAIEKGLNAENSRLLTSNADLRAEVERLHAAHIAHLENRPCAICWDDAGEHDF